MTATISNELLQQSLYRSEERFHAMFEQSAVGMAMADGRGRFIKVNDAFAGMLGYKPHELIGTSFLDITHPEDLPRAQSLLMRAEGIASPAVTYEKRYLRRDGAEAWVRATVNRLFDSDGTLRGYAAVVQDITEERLARLTVQRQIELQHDIVDQMPLMVAIWRDSKLLHVNRAWQRTFGYTCEEARSLDVIRVMVPDEQERSRAEQMIAGAGCDWVDLSPIARDGTPILSSWMNVPLADGTSMAIGQDVRERRAVEAQLAQSQKMEALGQLAGGVAHDFNNLLTVINGCLSFVKARLSDDVSAMQDVTEIAHAADRAAGLTRQLLAFSRRQVLQPTVIDVNAETTQAAKPLRRLVGEHIVLTVLADAERPMVEVDPVQLDQVIMNLVVNARDALVDGGTITVTTENVERRDEDGTTRDYLALCVADDGCGVPPEIRDQIFNPFFTTKEVGRGTGLGLATVHGIITQSGGRIELESELGVGTTFRVLLPTVDACPIAPVATRTSGEHAARRTVLVVEDETALRSAVVRMLRGAGYDVLDARHGEDALDALAQRDDVDLLVTDVVMPQMGGRELATRVWEVRPDMPVLFITGYTDDELLRKGALEQGARVLRKPFSSAELLEAVAGLQLQLA